jgi:hypothetical protein
VNTIRTILRWRQLVILAALALAFTIATARTTGAPVTASFSGLVYNRATQTFNSVLTITNNGPTLYAPISIDFTSLQSRPHPNNIFGQVLTEV